MLAHALAIAIVAFGAPACGTPTARYADLQPLVAGVAAVQRCQIRVDRRDWTWLRLCTTVGHEMRHLHGYRNRRGLRWHDRRGWHVDHQHSPNPWSLMYPRYLHPWPRCRPGR